MADHVKLNQLADNELFGAMKLGNERALTEIHDRYSEIMYRYVYKKTGDRDAARDVVQEMLINIWSRKESLELKGSLPSYLLKAAHNGSLNYLKQQANQQRLINAYQLELNQHAPAADQPLLDKDMDALLDRAIANMPPRLQQILHMRLKEHLSNKEIGQQLGIAEETVKSHIKRAVIALKKYFLLLFLLSLCLFLSQTADKKAIKNLIQALS